MKNNLPYFTHETNARNHPKIKAIRARFDFAGVGRFWALNEIIAESDNCRLDLSRKIYKSNLADELKITPAELDEFLEFLADPEECGIINYENNEIWTDHTQNDLSKAMLSRERSKGAYQKKSRKNDDSTHSLQNNSVESSDSTDSLQNNSVESSDSTDSLRNNFVETVNSTVENIQRRGEERRAEESIKKQEEEGGGKPSKIPAAPENKISMTDVEAYITGFSLALEISEYFAIADFLNKHTLPLVYLNYILEEVKAKRPNNFTTFFRKAVFWPDLLARYKIRRTEEASKKSKPPKLCPSCGKATIYTTDRAACKACGIFWDYDQNNNSWEIDQVVGNAKIAAG